MHPWQPVGSLFASDGPEGLQGPTGVGESLNTAFVAHLLSHRWPGVGQLGGRVLGGG